MSEQPVGTPASEAAEQYRPIGFPSPPLYRRPRVVVKADLVPAIRVAALVGLLGIAVGWIWSRTAPPEQVGVAEDGQILPLIDESYHRFDAIAIFLLYGLAAGLITGLAVWLLRERRGPTMLLGAVAGSALAGWLAMRTGISFADAHYPLPASPVVGAVFNESPRLASAWVVIAWPLGVALVYGVLAAWYGDNDLGRRLG